MRISCLALALVLASAVRAQEAEPVSAWRTEQRDIRIPMRDGRWLAADLYLPPARARYPAVLIQTPYDKRRLGAPMSGAPMSGGRGAGGRGAGGLFDREHYAYVVVDWRGFFGSRAAKAERRGDRGDDGYDSVEWVAAQPWSDGKVGSWGPSALGKVQYDTAAKQPPHLVCCVPVVAAMGQQESFYVTGGVLRESHVASLDRLGFGVGEAIGRARGRTRFWKIAKQRTYRPERIAVPMLLITGWWDHYPDEILQTFADLRARGGEATRAHSKLLIGPWDHMSVGKPLQGDWRFPDAAPEYEHSVRLFLDYWLRDRKDNGWADVATVRFWRINEQGYEAAKQWPGDGVAPQTWHLHPDGTIRRKPRNAGGAPPRPRTFVIDPDALPPTLGGANLPPLRHGPIDQAPITDRADVLVWDTRLLESPLRITGGVRVVLRCSAEAASFDIAVRLCVLDGDGRSMLLGDSIRRVDNAAGRAVEVEVVLPATAATVPRGQRLRLIVAGGNHPRFERNPDLKQPVTITVGAGAGSLVIPAAAIE